jgi:hypothetical protein
MKNMKLNKKVLRIISITDDVDDKSYWLKKKPQERIAFIEFLRKINYGKDATSSRLQRFFEIAELSQD